MLIRRSETNLTAQQNKKIKYNKYNKINKITIKEFRIYGRIRQKYLL